MVLGGSKTRQRCLKEKEMLQVCLVNDVSDERTKKSGKEKRRRSSLLVHHRDDNGHTCCSHIMRVKGSVHEGSLQCDESTRLESIDGSNGNSTKGECQRSRSLGSGIGRLAGLGSAAGRARASTSGRTASGDWGNLTGGSANGGLEHSARSWLLGLGAVGRGLDVCLGGCDTKTVGDRLHGVLARADGHGKEVTDSKVDSLLVEVVLENDETSVELGGHLLENRLKLGQSSLTVGLATGDVPVGGVECLALVPRPHDRSETHLSSNSTDAVVNVSVRGTEGVGGYADGVLDSLLGPAELRDNLLVGELGEGCVSPSVDRDLVASKVLGNEDIGVRQDTGANDEEGRLDVVGVEVVEEERSVGRGSVIEGDTPVELVGADRDVSLTGAATTSPPTTGGISSGLGGGSTLSGSGAELGNQVPVDLRDPLLDFWRVNRGSEVVGWEVGRGGLCGDGRSACYVGRGCTWGSSRPEGDGGHGRSILGDGRERARRVSKSMNRPE